MIKPKGIPREDLDLINKSFKTKSSAQAIVKDPSGKKVVALKKDVNEKPYVIGSFWGRKLRYNKWVIPKGGKQILVGSKGQIFDDIPEDLRKQAAWMESDFEK